MPYAVKKCFRLLALSLALSLHAETETSHKTVGLEKTINPQGDVIAFTYGHTQRGRRENTFYFNLFPEAVSIPDEAPTQIREGTDDIYFPAPLRLAELKNYPQLQTLDFSALPLLKLDGTRFEHLKTMTLTGEISGLKELDLPQLEELNLIGTVPMSDDELPHSRSRTFRLSQPPEPSVPGKILRLSPRLPSLKRLHLSGVSSADFDYSALDGKPLEELSIRNYDGADLNFLAGSPLRSLMLNARNAKNLDLLGTLPLKELTLDAPEVKNFDFLKKLKLETLRLKVPRNSNFRLELLADMPLKTLHLMQYFGTDANFAALAGKDLRELALINVGMESAAFLETLPLRNLALMQCRFREPPFRSIGKISSLEMLYLGRIDDENGKPLNFRTDLGDLSGLNLKALSIMDNQLEFCRSMDQLKSLKIILAPNGERSTVNLAQLKGKSFRILLISNFENWKDTVEQNQIQADYSGKAIYPFFLSDISWDIPSPGFHTRLYNRNGRQLP